MTVLTLGSGCHASDFASPIQAGPATGPDGAFRRFEAALRDRNAAGVGAELARVNFRYRLPGEELSAERIAFGRAIIEHLHPLVADALTLTDDAVVVPIRDNLGRLIGGRASLNIWLHPANADPADATARLHLATGWVMENHAWRLASMQLNNQPLLPPRPEGRN